MSLPGKPGAMPIGSALDEFGLFELSDRTGDAVGPVYRLAAASLDWLARFSLAAWIGCKCRHDGPVGHLAAQLLGHALPPGTTVSRCR